MSTVSVTILSNGVAHVELCRPKQGNAMNVAFWREYREAFERLRDDSDVRAIVVSGQGKFFTVGLDLKDAGVFAANSEADPARNGMKFRRLIIEWQETFTAMEKCPQPVLVAVHNACIGGGIDLMTACDIRYCTQDAFFSIKEVDVGLAADVGTLQRIQHVIGASSLVRELAYTARRMEADEALKCGFVTRVFPNKEEMLKHTLAMAGEIAAKSPIAIAGTKHNLNYSRGRTVEESLAYMGTWNAAMLQTEDMMKAAQASIAKGPAPEFAKL